MSAGLEMVNHTNRRTREQDGNGQAYSFTHQGTFHSFGQCIQLGIRTKASFKTASKLFNQQHENIRNQLIASYERQQ